MKNRTESCSYRDLAEDLAAQFEAGENVDAGTILYLRDYSPHSRDAYDYLMDCLAAMYDVTSLDSLPPLANTSRNDTLQKMGHFVIGRLD